MNICIVTQGFSTASGQGNVNYQIVRHLASSTNHKFYLISTHISDSLTALDNVYHYRVDIPDYVKIALIKDQVFAIRSRKQVLELLKNEKIDIVHLNGSLSYCRSDVNASHFVHSSWLQSAYHPWKLEPGVRSFYRLFYSILNSVWEKRAYRAATKIVAVSDFVQGSLINDCKIRPDKIEVVWNGVDNSLFRPLAVDEPNFLREVLDLSQDTFLVFFTGDIKTNRKNLDLVLRALSKLSSEVHLAIAGGTGGSIYPEMVKEMGLEERVHFLGYRRDLAKLLRGADAFAFPSNYDPCPLVLLEALACSVPVITTQTVGNSALIEHGNNGFVLQGGSDLKGLVEVLQRLVQEPELRHKVGVAGRRTAERYSWEAMASEYEAIYQELYEEKQKALCSTSKVSFART